MSSPKVEIFYTNDINYVIIYHSSDTTFILDGMTLNVVKQEVVDVIRSIKWPDRPNGPRFIDISN